MQRSSSAGAAASSATSSAWAGHVAGWLILATVFACGLSGWAQQWWAYDRAAVLNAAQWWRPFTASFTHLTPAHAVTNFLALAVIGMIPLYWRVLSARRFWVLLVLLGGVSHVLLLPWRAVTAVWGASAVCHALVLWYAVWVWLLRRQGGVGGLYWRLRWAAVAVFAVMLAKLWLEQAWAQPVAPSPVHSFAIVLAAHLTGSVGGAMVAAAEWLLGRGRFLSRQSGSAP
jgi:membrane associated rhomboid family serine protease